MEELNETQKKIIDRINAGAFKDTFFTIEIIKKDGKYGLMIHNQKNIHPEEEKEYYEIIKILDIYGVNGFIDYYFKKDKLVEEFKKFLLDTGYKPKGEDVDSADKS